MILEGARFWPLCVAAALLTECGGGQVPLVAGAPSGGAPAADHPATSSGDNLLYVATSDGVLVRYFSTGKPILTLEPQKFADFACQDQSLGYVYIDAVEQFYEYTFGGRKPAAKSRSKGLLYSEGCAVDPVARGIATTWNDTSTSGSGSGWVAVYKSIRGHAKRYSIPGFGLYEYCGYDNQGNLFVDGYSDNNAFVFAELPRGSTQFKPISVEATLKNAGVVQWDGSYLTVEDRSTPPRIYRLQISGSTAHVAGTVTLRPPSGTLSGVLTWIQGGTVVAPLGTNYSYHAVGYWKYPAGGKPYHVVRHLTSGTMDQILDAIIVSPPSR